MSQCIACRTVNPAFADKSEGGTLPGGQAVRLPCYSKGFASPPTTQKLGGRCPPDPPLNGFAMESSWQILIFPKHTFFSNFKLWEIAFMGFLTHRNLPETLGGVIYKNCKMFMFVDLCLCTPILFIFIFSNLLVCLSGPLLNSNLLKILVPYKKLRRTHYSNP